MSDWYDKQACHTGNVQVWDRTNGRIYKISHRNSKKVVGIDLQKKTDAELVAYQLHENDWYVRHARRILQERAIPAGEILQALEKIQKEHKDDTKRLRAMWAYHVCCPNSLKELGTGADDPYFLDIAMRDESPAVRAWAVQLFTERTTIESLYKIGTL